MGFDEDFMLGLATILKEVISEAEGVSFTACDDFNGTDYLIYEPTYPWNMGELEYSLSEGRVKETLQKYVSILTDKAIDIDYQSIENGG